MNGLNVKKHRKEIVFIIDLLIFLTVYLVLFFAFPEYVSIRPVVNRILAYHLLLMIFCGAISQFVLKTYDSLWRYAQSKEYLLLQLGGISGYLLYLIFSSLFRLPALPGLFPLAVYSCSLIGMLLMRFLYRQYRKRIKLLLCRDRIPVAIIGAGEVGVLLLEELIGDRKLSYKPVCFIDDDIEKIGKRIHNIEVKGPISQIQDILAATPVKEILIAIPRLKPEKRREIIGLCSGLKCRIRILPDAIALLGDENRGNLWSGGKGLPLEELLGRDQIKLDDAVSSFLYHKTVMITGGGGSIGSELCRQIAKAAPKKLIILDYYENNAYDIQQELIHRYGSSLNLSIEIASVRDFDKINLLMKKYRPDIVFHAAAHKHVPLMEDNPDEAIRNNIFGTYNVAKAADRYKVEKFVLISTDKAVNPTSIMGASKCFCEMILQSMGEDSHTEFVTVRFGNVLGSNGSVIPLFQKQIEEGGPVTITDKRMVRYFMTITEAGQLVLQAGAMAKSSEVYVLDMGEPVKILELAENLIRQSGYIPYIDIPIIETGLRPGEKLYEEMLVDKEKLIETENQKIFVEHRKSVPMKEIKKRLELLKKAMEKQSKEEIIKTMKRVVPSYRDPEEVNRCK